MTRFALIPVALSMLLLACGGLEKKCGSNNDCDAASYCSIEIGACFGRSNAVPIITAVDPGPASGQITVVGTGQPGATIRIFTDSQCRSSPVGTGTADASGHFSVDATPGAPSGQVHATADVGGVESACSGPTPYQL
jgi:hypothetical protein